MLSELDLIGRQGATAADIMSRQVTSVGEDSDVDEVGRLFVNQRLRRVPVVAEGRLVGIVSRSDLLRGVLHAVHAPPAAAPAAAPPRPRPRRASRQPAPASHYGERAPHPPPCNVEYGQRRASAPSPPGTYVASRAAGPLSGGLMRRGSSGERGGHLRFNE